MLVEPEQVDCGQVDKIVKWFRARKLLFKKSVSKVEDMFLAFCMASAPRAGQDSPCSGLQPEIRKLIFEHVTVFHVPKSSDPLPGFSDSERAGFELRSALKNAWDGSTLLVPPGTYALFGPVQCDKNITIEGRNPQETIIYNAIPLRFCIHIQPRSESNIRISGITINHRGTEDKPDYSESTISGGVSVAVLGGSVVLHNCEILSDGFESVRVDGGRTSLELIDCNLRTSSEFCSLSVRYVLSHSLFAGGLDNLAQHRTSL
mmetsp:Transcript_45225/g.120291  ORF Transcript_45225/g.120291 Transcript_45225/m.120291 type:complete len:261 (-) Transcript_45225:211-993(-)